MKTILTFRIILFFWILICSSQSASIKWERDLISDPNTNSSPLASCVNETSNGIYIVTKTVPQGTSLSKDGHCNIWEIGKNGNIMRQTPLMDRNGNAIHTNAIISGYGCALGSDDAGNLLAAGIIGEQRKERSVSVILNEDGNMEDPNIILGSQIDRYSIQKILPFQENAFVLMGAREGDGFFYRIDNQGIIQQEMLFDHGQTEILSGGTYLKPNCVNVAVCGLSFKEFTSETSEYIVENYISTYDPNDVLIHEGYFTGDYPELLAALPKVCSLENSNLVVVFYGKSKRNDQSKLRARCYSSVLQFLWEKDLIAIDQEYFSFDISSANSNCFIVAIPTLEGLSFYSFNKEGNIVNSTKYHGMISTSGFNLIQVNGRTFAIFEEGEPGRLKDITIRAKVIALE